MPPLGRVRRAEGILVPARAGDGAAREGGGHAWLGVRVRVRVWVRVRVRVRRRRRVRGRRPCPRWRAAR